jgi:hypothetical protein
MSFLYKYLPPERSTYLSDSLLRFSPPSALNDPYECRPGITEELEKLAYKYLEAELSKLPEYISTLSRNERRVEKRSYEKNLKKKLSALKNDPEIINDYFYTQAINNLDKNLGILSLSKRWDSGLMWSHYTQAHQGFCVGFDDAHEYFRKESPKAEIGDFILEQVSYSNERSMVPNQRPTKKESFNIMFSKSSDWEYEKEVRAIDILKNANETIEMKPYNLSLFNVPHEAVGEIIIGLRANENLCKSISKFGKKHSIPVYKAKVSKRSFDIDRLRLQA